ncbi:Regulator of RNase E activity RraA [Polaromonas sp. OV174]|uniref:RraA family protein n=1 Tax=Polaromonas sp. OV174 TaxID=1855300 RepID=UPI0008F080E2|nr:RraA family protein [Polaromonas sp. OV174]SFB90471.1 Regulator of RNase E activity RraA [Polaromonas sp. OV174]
MTTSTPTSPSSTTAATWPPGYRINPRADSLPADLVEAFRAIPVATAGDCMGRSVGALGLHGYHGNLDTVLCGTAFTVRVRPGDNLMIHKALTMVQPGDVLVIDGGGDLTQALIGGLMRTTCLVRQLGGLVIDGALRDRLEWAEGGLPVFARGHTHRGPSKEGPGEINVPVACAGLVVQPGDLVLGDADGVIAIPAAEAATVLQRAKLHLAKEALIRASNLAGTSDPERFSALLRAKGLPV